MSGTTDVDTLRKVSEAIAGKPPVIKSLEDTDTPRGGAVISRPEGKYLVDYNGLWGKTLAYKNWYHFVIGLSWINLILLIGILFLTTHIVFGTIYYFDRKGITEARTWLDCFFFSVQTMETIGYGRMAPVSIVSNIIMTVQTFLGTIWQSAVTGIIFVKMARPSKNRYQVLFSKYCVINRVTHTYQNSVDLLDEGSNQSYKKGSPALVFRVCNTRLMQICEPQFQLLLIRKRTGRDGDFNPDRSRSFPYWNPEKGLPVDMVIDELNYELFRQTGRIRGIGMSLPRTALPWTVVHPMDKFSPLYGCDLDDLRAMQAEVVCIIDGTDEAVGNCYQSRWSWVPSEIKWDFRFRDMVTYDPVSKRYQVDFDQFNECVPVQPEEYYDSDGDEGHPRT